MASYPHMCRMDHVEIGHSDSEHERCPLCRALDELAWVKAQADAMADGLARVRSIAGDGDALGAYDEADKLVAAYRSKPEGGE